MTYIDSNLIGSFPTTKRNSVNKLITENSITRLINRLIDVDGYVISSEINDNNVDWEEGVPTNLWSDEGLKDFEFSLRGYYFCIKSNSSGSGVANLIVATGFPQVVGTESKLYANIYIDKVNKDYPELWGQDAIENEGVPCRAVQFTIDDETPIPPEDFDTGNYDGPYKLLLLHWKQLNDGSGWNSFIPVESIFKFKSKSIIDIDGGEIV